ncbi:phytochrome B-like [Dorcoceras hygrometricum]|uniref:Phytochrome B-like n=1 Tax=Dorcoceras hygrometricum TaxID=472368 RepID=A0A2Z7A1Z1_9LAMI|nr:phytochrome B-like [Dorcoceras hygrometricum]
MSFRNIFAQGILTESFFGYFQDTDVQNFSDFGESSSDGSTVYRSPSPLRDESLTLGPTAAHEEQFYFVQSPDSTPATSPCLETSTSSTSLSMHFDTDDIALAGAAGIQKSLPVGRTEFVEALDDLRAFILQRVDDYNSAILSKLHTLERGLRDTLHDQDANTRKLINSVCQDAHTMSDVQKIHLNDVKKTVLAPGVTAGADSLEIRRAINAVDAKMLSLDGL